MRIWNVMRALPGSTAGTVSTEIWIENQDMEECGGWRRLLRGDSRLQELAPTFACVLWCLGPGSLVGLLVQ